MVEPLVLGLNCANLEPPISEISFHKKMYRALCVAVFDRTEPCFPVRLRLARCLETVRNSFHQEGEMSQMDSQASYEHENWGFIWSRTALEGILGEEMRAIKRVHFDTN